MKKYKEVCNKLKGKEVKISNVRSALLEISGGSRDVLLQIKVEAQEKEQLSTGLLAGASLLVAVVTMSITKPGITKGQHWHNGKWELFIVVSGHGLIQERNINTGEMVEFEVSGEKIEAVYMIPGWTHNIINLSETENLVTVMTCNEVFDKGRPDTFGEVV